MTKIEMSVLCVRGPDLREALLTLSAHDRLNVSKVVWLSLELKHYTRQSGPELTLKNVLGSMHGPIVVT